MIDLRVIACARACGVDPLAILSRSRNASAIKARVAAVIMLREDGHPVHQCVARIGRYTKPAYYRIVAVYKTHQLEVRETIRRARCMLAELREKSRSAQPVTPRPDGRCIERGCPMPAARAGYCRYHWAMMREPEPFRRQAIVSAGRLRSGDGKVSLIRVVG